MSVNIKIYILTHKKIKERFMEPYVPLVNGSALLNDDFGYLRDDTGVNISKLNVYYAELTGQYWAWKNSDAEIIGFCHYRRWFVKGLKFNKLTSEDILKDLEDYDIILPQKSVLSHSLKETIIEGLKNNPNYGARWEDYLKLKDILKNKFPDYYPTFENIMNNNECYSANMFIAHKNLANEYFSWLFLVLDELKNEIDFDQYPENNKRVLGFFSETLLMVFVYKNNLSIKEHLMFLSERKFPFMTFLNNKFPIIRKVEKEIFDIINTQND